LNKSSQAEHNRV